ncbi:MAG: glycosyltransferase [Burkholderiales bacterium]
MHQHLRAASVMSVGVVVIGRNEGERLRKCLESVRQSGARVVYVDSGSTDASVDVARAMGVDAVALDMSAPFTAARARNRGFRRLCELERDCQAVQFVDGDCELAPRWLERGLALLAAEPRVAVVCGRLREKHPESSVYNMLCDIEWDAPEGEAKACGGLAMMRADAFESVGGFREDMIAGEEPELCLRLRAAGWRIRRLGDAMARHDAAISRFGQWWRRSLRGGYSYALGASLHGSSCERHRVRESRSAWFWGIVLPTSTLALGFWWGAWAFGLLLAYPLQVARLALHGGRTPRENWWRALFLVIGKFPEMLGQAKFVLDRAFGGKSRLIEHK